MLTRLKVTGFKNLVDVDVHFGPFTCIAGVNGVGKSNLFDAIRFLSALADRPLLEAAKSVRDDTGKTADVRSLFHRVGSKYDDVMSFAVEMIVPSEGSDDLGQQAKARITFLSYALELAYKEDTAHGLPDSLELKREELYQINLGEAKKHLPFKHSFAWRKSAVQGRRTTPFISTELTNKETLIKLHQDGSGGNPLTRSAATLPRTVLSATNAAESPTALLARREMQSWRLLQLEPSSLRKPDDFTAPARLGWDGSHLPSTLFHLARTAERFGTNGGSLDSSHLYGCIATELAGLISDVKEVRVDRDEKRELLTLQVIDQDGTPYSARSLSDGTLRFLALAVLKFDPEARGVICLEEPENGIHPERIPAMLQLLQDICTDVDEPVSIDNPLRQVIVNTHSPAVVLQVPDDSVLVAELREVVKDSNRFKRAFFSCLPETWRAGQNGSSHNVVSRGKLLGYLNPTIRDEGDLNAYESGSNREATAKRRVMDNPHIQQLIGFPPLGGPAR